MHPKRLPILALATPLVLSLAAPPLSALEPTPAPQAAVQTGPARRVLAADYSRKRIGIVTPTGKLEWEYPIQQIHDAWFLPGGNVLLQTSWTRIVEVTPRGDVAWEYDAATRNGNANRKVEVHAFQRLADGNTMIAESGPARIIEIDVEGKLRREVPLQVEHPHPHRDTRLVRKLKSGHYLVSHEGDNAVREYDPQGKVVWQYDVGFKVYSAERLEGGNTLIGCGDGHRVLEVDPQGKTVWSLTDDDLPDIQLAWITMVERLSNGNTRLVNCHAGPENPQMLEVTPEKRVVWTFRDFRHFGNATAVARVLD